MTIELPARALDVDLLARELGNWRTSSHSGPAYQGLADGIRMLIVDGRLPVGARLPSERALADTLRVSRTTVTAAYAQLRDDGYLNARRGARSTTALPVSTGMAVRAAAPATVSLAEATLSAPVGAMMDAFADATREVMPYLHDIGVELTGVAPLREAIAERYCARGLPTEPDEIMVTTGALHAIGLILATYIQPGDRVLVEQPTYHGALSAIMTTGARPVPVAMTDDGWELDAVHSAVQAARTEPGLPGPRQPQSHGLTLSEVGSPTPRHHHRRNPDSHNRRRDDRRHVAGRAGACADGGLHDDSAGSGVDDRLDVEVVLGWPTRRLDPRRTQHTGDHRHGASVDRHGHRDRRTARRRSASSPRPTSSYRSGARYCVLGATC